VHDITGRSIDLWSGDERWPNWQRLSHD